MIIWDRKRWLGILLTLVLPLLSMPASAEFTEGSAYARLIPEQPTTTGDKIEVVELFWYGCPHCHRFQPAIERWLRDKPENVVWVRMPAVLSDRWAIHAQAFYAAEALGVLERIHAPLFNAIHNERRSLNTEAELTAFFAEQGVDPDAFRKTFHSFSVQGKVRRARQMTARYHISGTPEIIVNGKYRTGPGFVNNFDTVLKVVDFLIQKEQARQ